MIERNAEGAVLTEAVPMHEQGREAARGQVLRLGAIDVGSNAIRFLAARFDGDTAVETLGYERVPVRLGHSALLHDVGQFISFRRHHKHSRYLIEHSDLSGVAPREIPMVALVARYHRRTLPKDRHYLYRDLTEDQRRRVRGISAILRVADALDREHVQRVTSVEAAVLDGRVVIRPQAEGDLSLERWAMEQKSRLFEAEYGLSVRLELD